MLGALLEMFHTLLTIILLSIFFIPVLLISKLRLGVKLNSHGHPGSKWQRQDLNCTGLTLGPMLSADGKYSGGG